MPDFSFFHRLRRRIRLGRRRRSLEAEIDAEMRQHIEFETEALARTGLAADEARRRAQVAFGGIERFKEEAREVRGTAWLEAIRLDLRYGWRMMHRRPGLTATIALTLGLGIGATTAVYSLVDAVLLRPYPVDRPGELVAVYQAPNNRNRFGGTAYPTYLDYRNESRALRDLAAVSTLDVGLQINERMEQVSAAVVTGNYFTLLGIRPALGRTLLPADESLAAESPVVVLSDRTWRAFFSADPGVIGRTVLLSGSPFTVVGVAPRAFRGVDLAATPDLWVPITEVRKIGAGGLFSLDDILTTRFLNWLTLVGRLPADGAPATAEAELNTIALRVRAATQQQFSFFPRDTVAAPITVTPLASSVAVEQRADLVRFLGLLGGIVVITLLVACTNVANLTLTRIRERDREFGIRIATGAGTGRLVRQLAVEIGMYAVLGGMVALAIAQITRRLLTGFVLPGGIALDHLETTLSAPMLALATVLVFAAAAGASLGPAIRASRRERGIELVNSGAPGPRRGGRWGPPLLTMQIGLSVVLLVIGTLFMQSLRTALTTDLGFDASGVAAATLSLRVAGYSEERADAFLTTLVDQPLGAHTVALASHVPLAPPRTRLPISPEGRDSSVSVAVNAVSPAYFPMFNIRLLAGELFHRETTVPGAPAAVVNRAAAELLWPGENPIGHRFQLVRRVGAFYTVSGVVETTKYHAVTDEAVPYIYVPIAAGILGVHDQVHVLTREPRGSGPESLAYLRALLREQDPLLPIRDTRIVTEQLDGVLMPQRFGSMLLGVFGVIALLISAAGIYGVAAHTVAMRTRELGIRAAVGASRAALASAVLRPTVLALAIGAVGGLTVAASLAGLFARFLFGVSPYDPGAYLIAVAVLFLAAGAASWLPARRAARLSPLIAIRE